MNQTMHQTIRKLLFFLIIQVIYYNLLYILFIPEIYAFLSYLIALIIYYIISFSDTMLRPLQDEDRDPESDKYTIILIFLFLGNPLFLIASVIERKALIEQFFPIWNQEFISMIGIILFTLSGVVMLLGRIQLGQYATGKLSIQDEHELIEKGLYKYIRHPIYAGGIIGGFFFLMAFNSIIIAIIYTLLMLIVFNKRASYEEKILSEEFGQDYLDYQKRTKKYIPFLY